MCVCVCSFVLSMGERELIVFYCFVCVCVHAYVLFIQKGTNINFLFHVTHMICVILIDGPLLTF